MGKEGWISIHRRIQDCWIWNEDVFSRGQAWIDMLLMANHSDVKIMFNGNLVEVKIGSFITSILKLSERWKWSRHKVSDFLNVLESDGMIVQNRDNKRTLINIVNYSVYQSDEGRKGQQKDNTGTSKGHQKDTNNNDNNDNNDNNNIFSKENIRRTDMQRVVDEWNTLSEFGVKSVSKMSSGTKRYDSLNARLKQYSVEDVLKAIDNIRHSSFLQGGSKKGWMITFDWFVLPNNFVKVFEGNYNDKQETLFENNSDDFGGDY